MKNKSDDQYTKEIIAILKEKTTKDYKPGETKREAHSKCIGLLKANFIVMPNLPPELKVGIFKEQKTYPALIRISNSNPKIKGDNKKDVRGFAIKLLDVPGHKYSKDEHFTQDFLLVSAKTMPLGTVKLFYEAIYYNLKVNPLAYLFKVVSQGNVHKLKEINSLRKHHTSPLDIYYYSTTPYFFNDKYVKYCLAPKSTYKSELPNKLTPTYLSDNMQNHLNNNIAKFDFMIQFRKGDMPINDASVEWDEKLSPFIKIGELIIDKQNFRTDSRYSLCENLSFSPGHSLLDHKPAGSLNKARTTIYKEMSLYRHKRNNTPPIEPTVKAFDSLK